MADIKTESRPELDNVVASERNNPKAEIVPAGHTSSERNAALNRSLSYRRVKGCKDCIVPKGIVPGRIAEHGYGPHRPVAPKETRVNRARSGRGEIRVVKL